MGSCERKSCLYHGLGKQEESLIEQGNGGDDAERT